VPDIGSRDSIVSEKTVAFLDSCFEAETPAQQKIKECQMECLRVQYLKI
jgi:hypothetical protein